MVWLEEYPARFTKEACQHSIDSQSQAFKKWVTLKLEMNGKIKKSFSFEKIKSN
jgi:hypothetical protein